ncbi:hypothetical protein V6Z11_A06G127400, partial [Gossypium hirsutum]
SICSARDFIADGLVWRIGNGNSVNIWNDPWLPGQDNNRVSVQHINTSWTIVNQLIDAEESTWKKDDLLVWKFEATGSYSGKREYKVLISEHLKGTNCNGYSASIYKDFCKLLWELQIPSKIKIHVWRLINNYVPHFVNLFHMQSPEDSNHLLWRCTILQQLWTSLTISFAPNDLTSHGKDIFIKKFIEADVSTRQILIFSLWALWNSRNKQIYERVRFSKQDFIGFIRRYGQDLLPSHTYLKHFPSSKRHQLWRSPNSGTIKLNFDRSFLKEAGISFAAVLARDEEGQFLEACTYPSSDVVDAVVAEARAYERAMLFAAELG